MSQVMEDSEKVEKIKEILKESKSKKKQVVVKIVKGNHEVSFD